MFGVNAIKELAKKSPSSSNFNYDEWETNSYGMPIKKKKTGSNLLDSLSTSVSTASNNVSNSYNSTNEAVRNIGSQTTTKTPEQTAEEKRIQEERDAKQLENAAFKEEYDSKVNSARLGETDFEGAINRTQMGKTLQDNIMSEMGGKESNALLTARQMGSEALARKAQDVRGAAAQNAIMNGQLGQGAAQTGKMKAEMDIMRGLGDFQTEMAGLASTEQQNAQNRALQALGMMQGDDQIAETKRQAMISDDVRDKSQRLDFIKEAREGGMPGSYGVAMDEFSQDVLTPEGYQAADTANKAHQTYLDQQTRIMTEVDNLDNAYDIDNHFTKNDDGTYSWDGEILDPTIAQQISSIQENDPDYQRDQKILDKKWDSLTPEDWSYIASSPDVMEANGMYDGIDKEDNEKWDDERTNAEGKMYEFYNDKYLDKYVEQNGVMYKVIRVDEPWRKMNDMKTRIIGVRADGTSTEEFNLRTISHDYPGLGVELF